MFNFIKRLFKTKPDGSDYLKEYCPRCKGKLYRTIESKIECLNCSFPRSDK